MLVGFLLQACASGGNESLVKSTDASVDVAIIKGQTNKAQIESIFGDPFETSFLINGNLLYKYRYDDTSALNAKTVASVVFTYGLAGVKYNGSRMELVILFDENNVVKNYNFSTSEVDYGTRIFSKNNKR